MCKQEKIGFKDFSYFPNTKDNSVRIIVESRRLEPLRKIEKGSIYREFELSEVENKVAEIRQSCFSIQAEIMPEKVKRRRKEKKKWVKKRKKKVNPPANQSVFLGVLLYFITGQL